MSSRPFRMLLDAVYGAYFYAAFCFITFVVFFPLILLAPVSPRRRREIARVGVRANLLAFGVPFRVRGAEHLPPGPCIVVANHASYLDGLVLTAALPSRFAFLIKAEVQDWPYAGPVTRRLGQRFVNRSSAREGAVQMRALVKSLKEGESFAIFAEGTFHPDPGLHDFKPGAFLMACKAQVPVVPIAIRGTRRLYGADLKPHWNPVEVVIGQPIAPAGDARALRDAARAAVLAACGEPDALAGGGADRGAAAETGLDSSVLA